MTDVRIKVIIADDHAVVRQGIRIVLEEISGLEVLAEAGNGEEVLALLADHSPDLLVLDISMPKKNGVEVLKELVTELPDSGFMMITGNKDEAIAKECLTLGAFDYVSKPVNLETLAQKINLWLLTRKK